MALAKESNEQVIASEAFVPDLSGDYAERYNTLVSKLANVLPANRVGIIRKEMMVMMDEEESVDQLKYIAALSVLIDLSQQGWIFDIEDAKLVLKMETDNVDDKKMLRYRLSAERNAQFKTDSVASFIRRMESEKEYNDGIVSIKSLIGDSQLLLRRINNYEKVCDPYIQLVTNDRDEYTGYKLFDIWRYFRYTWSIPLLGGKLVSLLACSPVVIRDYTKRYSNQVSEIASRMKGKKVIRDSRLVYLGTTSLYATGSSQYNRIKVPLSNGGTIEFRKLGVTEGYGTVFFSKETTNLFSKILELQDGGKRINHVFGEGTSPRFRMISRGLNAIGIRADAFLRHYSPRIVYSINLAKNTNDFLLGIENDVDYGFDLDDANDVDVKTQEIIDFWYKRWLEKRLTTVDIEERLDSFNPADLLLGNI